MSSTSWQLVRSSLWPLAQGMLLGTIPLTAAAFVLGMVLALIVAVARISRVRALRAISTAYVSLIRGTPLLLQLFIIFYGLPSLGIVLPPWPSAILGFGLNLGAYASETLRAAILGVPRGQWEAASTVGLSRAMTMRRIVLPQAVRHALPPLGNSLISLVKDTSLASAVLVTEILRRAQDIAAPTFAFFLLYNLAAVYYWVLCQALTVVQGRMERRLARSTV